MYVYFVLKKMLIKKETNTQMDESKSAKLCLTQSAWNVTSSRCDERPIFRRFTISVSAHSHRRCRRRRRCVPTVFLMWKRRVTFMIDPKFPSVQWTNDKPIYCKQCQRHCKCFVCVCVCMCISHISMIWHLPNIHTRIVVFARPRRIALVKIN